MKNMQLWQTPLPLRLISSNRDHRGQGNPQHQHQHSFYELALVSAGSCIWHLGSEQVLVNSTEALLLQPGTMHGEEAAPEQKAQIGWLGCEFEGAVPAWCGQPVALGDDAPEITGYFEAIVREHHQADPRTLMRIGLALQSLLLLLERRAEGPSRHLAVRSGLNPGQTHAVEAAAHYFRNNLRDPLSIAQVASYHSLCPGHFSTLFRRRYRVTPRGFLLQSRLQRAADLLGESHLGLKEIAEQCGFVDAAHFCKSFKQARRMTPSQFRNKPRRQLHVEGAG